MSTGHFAVVSNGTVSNIIVYDTTTQQPTLPAGEALTTALDALSPMPQIGWAASQTNGVWSFTAPSAASPALTIAQQAAIALSAGVQITSTSTPALNSTYACDPASQQKMQAISLYCVVNGTFPGGGTTYPWLDMSGASHTLTSVAQGQALFTAVANYVAGIDFAIAGAATSLPNQPAPII